jgi:DNA-3-methyladenine glycosylase
VSGPRVEASAPAGPPLERGFFARSVHDVARDLVGCELLYDGVGGTIVETESYHRDDPACHAYGGPTPRSEILWGPPAIAYVYFSYGIHSLLNAVAEPEGEAAAVLVRALEPRWGVDEMCERRRRDDVRQLCSGPGKLTEALGVGLADNGRSLLEPPFELRAPSTEVDPVEVHTAPRVGITKAADLPWRFCAANSRFLSKPLPHEQ